MKKIIYIIPGQGENCNLARYKSLSSDLIKKGYVVHPVNPDWYKPISNQVFKIEKNSIIIGFSFGAVLAYLLAEKYSCKKLILASPSPIHTFKESDFVDSLKPYMSKANALEIFKDLKKIKINLHTLKSPYVTLMGQKETMVKNETPAQIYVPRTGHYLGKTYIKYILNQIQ